MKTKYKYIISVVIESIFLAFYILFPKLFINILGYEKNAINLLGLLIIRYFHFNLDKNRNIYVKEDLQNYKKINIIISIVRFIIGIYAVYILQVTLGNSA